MLRLAFGRPWRQTEGLLRPLTALLGVDVVVPDPTTFSQRSPGLALTASLAQAQAKVGCSVLNRITRLSMPVFQRVR